VAKPRTDAPVEDRAKELRKIAAGLRALASKIDAERLKYELSCTHGAKRSRSKRRFDARAAASGLLMDALILGGPEDESLRRILLSWRENPVARLLCYEHVCRVWHPLREVGKVPSDILRKIALGVSATGDA